MTITTLSFLLVGFILGLCAAYLHHIQILKALKLTDLVPQNDLEWELYKLRKDIAWYRSPICLLGPHRKKDLKKKCYILKKLLQDKSVGRWYNSGLREKLEELEAHA